MIRIIDKTMPHFPCSANAAALARFLELLVRCEVDEIDFTGERIPLQGEIATSFCGIGGLPPTEEVIMLLRVHKLRKPKKTYEFFPEMARLFTEITGKEIAHNKPILGERIFHVESGVHVDGILKSPECYEPFPPEVVGLTRKIVMGKHSGSASVKLKLAELGLACDAELIPLMLERIKTKGQEKLGEVTDAEVKAIYCGLNSAGR